MNFILIGNIYKIIKTLNWKPKTVFQELVHMVIKADLAKISQENRKSTTMISTIIKRCTTVVCITWIMGAFMLKGSEKLATTNHSMPIDLSISERKIFSQNGEDGVLEKIFSVIGTTDTYFVEFGTDNGEECNTRYLREKNGWSGLMMDGSYSNQAINLQKEFITAENINSLFSKYRVPHEFDLLSIDIDNNDFYVWHALEDYFPRVVVIEYNAMLGLEDKVVVYKPTAMWDRTDYYGASLLALKKLGNMKGYTLVHVDLNGVNAFFIREDIASQYLFKNANDEKSLYQPLAPSWRAFGYHERDPFNRPFLTFGEAI